MRVGLAVGSCRDEGGAPESGWTLNAGDRDRRGGLEQTTVMRISTRLTLRVQSLRLR